MPKPTKREQAIEALKDYLKYAGLHTTAIGVRNLIFRYVQANEGNEHWFEKFLGEIDGLFEFFDNLQTIYPNNENIDTDNE